MFGTGWLGVVRVRDGLGVEPSWLGSVSTREGEWGARRSCWGLVFVVRSRSRLHLLSIDVAERNAVGANEVWEGFAVFLTVDVAKGLGHLSWVVRGMRRGVYSRGPFLSLIVRVGRRVFLRRLRLRPRFRRLLSDW